MENNRKKRSRLAFYWCSSCGGCDESVIDLGGDLLSLCDLAEIVFWPAALDCRRDELEGFENNHIDACFINGAVRTDEQAEMVHLLRRKSTVVVAHGTCAHLGGVAGLANYFSKKELLECAYGTRGKSEPDSEQLHDTVKPLDRVISVDYYVPGCPPTPDVMKQAIYTVLGKNAQPEGRILSINEPLCRTCPRRNPDNGAIRLKKINRLYHKRWDPGECFLNQGFICMGPATRGGCEARCIRANMPCRGCFGSPGEIRDQGGQFISFLASALDAETTEELEKIIDEITDPSGLFYRYTLPASILNARRGRKISISHE